jgi:hypothetical protein
MKRKYESSIIRPVAIEESREAPISIVCKVLATYRLDLIWVCIGFETKQNCVDEAHCWNGRRSFEVAGPNQIDAKEEDYNNNKDCQTRSIPHCGGGRCMLGLAAPSAHRSM